MDWFTSELKLEFVGAPVDSWVMLGEPGFTEDEVMGLGVVEQGGDGFGVRLVGHFGGR